MARATGWLAEALRAEAAMQPRRMLAACRRGLEVLDDHRLTLGASELRAQATARGGELAALAERHAVQAHRPRTVARLDGTLASHRADRALRYGPPRTRNSTPVSPRYVR